MKKIIYVVAAVMLAACANANKVEDVFSVNKGTETAVVKVSLDDKGMPFIDTDPIIIKEGQRIVWVGPVDMEIRFMKNTPFTKRNILTKNAVINALIPKLPSWGKEEKERKFKYDVVVGKSVLDPLIIVRRGF